MTLRRAAVHLLAMFALAGCAAPTAKLPEVGDELERKEAEKQAHTAYWLLRARRARVWEVGYRLRSGNVGLCGEYVAPDGGFYVDTLDHYPEALRDAGRKRLGDRPVVARVYPGSPADVAGLKVDDAIASVDGSTDVVNDEIWRRAYADGAAKLRIERARMLRTVVVRPEPACASAVLLDSEEPELNAFADGSRVVVASGMLNFVENDRELALVIAHELAHNILGHVDKQMQNMVGGLIADIVLLVVTQGYSAGVSLTQAAKLVYSKEFEAEADYVGMYLLANAEYGLWGASAFWRRMGAEHLVGGGESRSLTHPSTAKRYLAIRKAIKEINAKREKGERLVPEFEG